MLQRDDVPDDGKDDEPGDGEASGHAERLRTDLLEGSEFLGGCYGAASDRWCECCR
jgi:hypothetical protein